MLAEHLNRGFFELGFVRGFDLSRSSVSRRGERWRDHGRKSEGWDKAHALVTGAAAPLVTRFEPVPKAAEFPARPTFFQFSFIPPEPWASSC